MIGFKFVLWKYFYVKMVI